MLEVPPATHSIPLFQFHYSNYMLIRLNLFHPLALKYVCRHRSNLHSISSLFFLTIIDFFLNIDYELTEQEHMIQ